MQLGANAFQATAIKAAKDLGHYVITVDYLPENPGHRFADEYHNISTVDRVNVLRLAQSLKIDGIMSYASDISAPTAAYVAEIMGLPGNPLESVEVLTHKHLTRAFLERHGFNVPKNRGVCNIHEAREFFNALSGATGGAVMVKPSDSNGSKGVSRVDDIKDLDKAFSYARSYSRNKVIIVEEFLIRDGYQMGGDAFIQDGEIIFFGFMNEYFDERCNPLVPIGESYPPILADDLKAKAKGEIQRFMRLLGMRIGAINMDFIVDGRGEVYIIEIGPRSGGNWISDALTEAAGIDLAKCVVKSALGEHISGLKSTCENCIASYIIHSGYNGLLQRIEYDPGIKGDIIALLETAKTGDMVSRFDNAGLGLGVLIFRSKDINEMLYRMDNMEKFIHVILS
jgi:biotin carboxylase